MIEPTTPTIQELSGIYGDWNPMAYSRGMRSQDLADQFRQQAFDSNAVEMRKNQMANDQAEQMNPLLIAQQQLTNSGLDTKNKSEALSYSNKVSLNDDQLKADRAALQEKYSASELAQIGDNVMRKHLENIQSGDLVGARKTQRLLEVLGTPAQVADRLERRAIADNNNATSIKTTGMHTASQERINQANIDAGKYNRNKFGVTIQTQLMKAKSAREKAEILEEAYYTADAAGDAPAAELYKKRALEARERAAEDARNQGLARPGIDVPAVAGLPAQEAPAAKAPIAGGGAKPGTADNPIVLK